MLGDEVQEIPLRHKGDEPAACRQMPEIGDLDEIVADLAAQRPCLLMRSPQEFLKQAELVHQLQGRGVDRVAAEIAQEIAVFFEDQNGDPGAAQEEAQHHAGRTPRQYSSGPKARSSPSDPLLASSLLFLQPVGEGGRSGITWAAVL